MNNVATCTVAVCMNTYNRLCLIPVIIFKASQKSTYYHWNKYGSLMIKSVCKI